MSSLKIDDDDPGGLDTDGHQSLIKTRPPSTLPWNIPVPCNSQYQPTVYNQQVNEKYQHESAAPVDRSEGSTQDICSATVGMHERKECHQYSTLNRFRVVSGFSSLPSGQPRRHDIDLQATEKIRASKWVYIFDNIHKSSDKNGIDPEKALDKLSDGKHQSVREMVFKQEQSYLNTIKPTSWRYALPSSASNTPLSWLAALLEKAVMRDPSSGRYIGLYPHSADPPLQNSETIPEYQHHNNTKNTLLHQRPIRSQQHQLHRPLTFTQSLLGYLLQLGRAVAAIFIAFLGFFRLASPRQPSYRLPTWNPKVVLNKNLKTSTYKRLESSTSMSPKASVHKRPEPYLCTMSYPQIFDEIDPDELEGFIGNDSNLSLFNFNNSNNSVPQQLEGPFSNGSDFILYSLPTSDYPTPGQLEGYPENNLDSTSINFNHNSNNFTSPYQYQLQPLYPFNQPHPADFYTQRVLDNHLALNHSRSFYPSPETGVTYTVTSFPLPIMSSTPETIPWELVNLPTSPTPAPAEVETDRWPQSEDIPPGLETPTMSVESISPQIEGLKTPTFTLDKSSPESVTSPLPSGSRRTFVCDEERCSHRVFTRRCDLNKHLKTHKKEIQCHHCESKFSTKKDRTRHERSIHEGQKDYVCELCGKASSRRDNLKDHQRRVHGIGK